MENRNNLVKVACIAGLLYFVIILLLAIFLKSTNLLVAGIVLDGFVLVLLGYGIEALEKKS